MGITQQVRTSASWVETSWSTEPREAHTRETHKNSNNVGEKYVSVCMRVYRFMGCGPARRTHDSAHVLGGRGLILRRCLFDLVHQSAGNIGTIIITCQDTNGPYVMGQSVGMLWAGPTKQSVLRAVPGRAETLYNRMDRAVPGRVDS